MKTRTLGSNAIGGAGSPERARENAAAGDLELSAEVCHDVDRILGGSRELTASEA